MRVEGDAEDAPLRIADRRFCVQSACRMGCKSAANPPQPHRFMSACLHGAADCSAAQVLTAASNFHATVREIKELCVPLGGSEQCALDEKRRLARFAAATREANLLQPGMDGADLAVATGGAAAVPSASAQAGLAKKIALHVVDAQPKWQSTTE